MFPALDDPRVDAASAFDPLAAVPPSGYALAEAALSQAMPDAPPPEPEAPTPFSSQAITFRNGSFAPTLIDLKRTINKILRNKTQSGEPSAALVTLMDECDSQLVDNHELRKLKTTFTKYTVPAIKYVGVQSNAGFTTGLVDPFSLAFRTSRTVSLPSSLVGEITAMLVGRERSREEYTAASVRTMYLTRTMQLSPDQLLDTIRYVPLLAWLRAHRFEQDRERILTHKYCCAPCANRLKQCWSGCTRKYAYGRHVTTGVLLEARERATFTVYNVALQFLASFNQEWADSLYVTAVAPLEAQLSLRADWNPAADPQEQLTKLSEEARFIRETREAAEKSIPNHKKHRDEVWSQVAEAVRLRAEIVPPVQAAMPVVHHPRLCDATWTTASHETRDVDYDVSGWPSLVSTSWSREPSIVEMSARAPQQQTMEEYPDTSEEDEWPDDFVPPAPPPPPQEPSQDESEEKYPSAAFSPFSALSDFDWSLNWGRQVRDVPAPRLVCVETNPGPGFMDSVNAMFGVRPALKPPLEAPLQLSAAPFSKVHKEKSKCTYDPTTVKFGKPVKDFMLLRGTQKCYAFDTREYAPVAFASNAHNEQRALDARVLAKTIQPTSDLGSCISWAKKNHRKLFGDIHQVQAVSMDEYIRRTGASTSVKAAIRAAYDALVAGGFDPRQPLTAAQIKRYTTRGGFVKVENNLYHSPLGQKHKAPRLIQSATAEFIAIVGPWFMALQDQIKRKWRPGHSNLVFTSGMSAEQTAAFLTSKVGEILEDDLGKFDSSISEPWCKYEVWLAKKFGAPLAVLQLMHANIKTRGKTTNGWKYCVPGTRKSGDPFTSLFNSIINGIAHLYLYCKWTGCSVEESRSRIWMLLQGDDNAMVHVDRTHFDWREGMAGLGFDSESFYRTSFDHLEFCSSRLYKLADRYTFGPKPGRVLAKLGYVIDPPPTVSRESMVRGIALGLEKQTSFIPPLRVVVKRLLALTEGHAAYYDRRYDAYKMNYTTVHKETPDVYDSLFQQYGWTPTIQKQFEKEVGSMRLGDPYPSCLAEILLDRDTSGPQRIFGA